MVQIPSVVPPADDHLLLGITQVGLEKWLRMVGFPYAVPAMSFDGEVKVQPRECGYEGSYTRSERVAWIDEVYGNPLLCYDACDRMRSWVTEIGHTDRSACEILLQTEEFAGEVGPANAFFSHWQGKSVGYVVGSLEMAHARYGEGSWFGNRMPSGRTYFWLDLTTLRQCQSDFSVHKIRDVIRSIGRTIAEVDSAGEYLKRTFCVFESFVTIEAEQGQGGKLLIISEDADEAAKLVRAPIDSENAQTWAADAKVQIDQWIREGVGFAEVNLKIKQALRRASMKSQRVT